MLISHSPQPPEELAVRGSDGVVVSLLWQRSDDALTVLVTDVRRGESFEVAVGSANPLEVFHHPYAYATSPACEACGSPRA
jgi:hypothetical protein